MFLFRLVPLRKRKTKLTLSTTSGSGVGALSTTLCITGGGVGALITSRGTRTKGLSQFALYS